MQMNGRTIATFALWCGACASALGPHAALGHSEADHHAREVLFPARIDFGYMPDRSGSTSLPVSSNLSVAAVGFATGSSQPAGVPFYDSRTSTG